MSHWDAKKSRGMQYSPSKQTLKISVPLRDSPGVLSACLCTGKNVVIAWRLFDKDSVDFQGRCGEGIFPMIMSWLVRRFGGYRSTTILPPPIPHLFLRLKASMQGMVGARQIITVTSIAMLRSRGDLNRLNLNPYYYIKDGGCPLFVASGHVHSTSDKTVFKIFLTWKVYRLQLSACHLKGLRAMP